MTVSIERGVRSTVQNVSLTNPKIIAISVQQASHSTMGSGPSKPRLQLHRNAQTLWPVLAKTAMHQRCLPEPYHPPERTSPATRKGVSEHARVRPGTAAKKEGGSLVRGTEESGRAASLAPAQTEVRARAILPGSGGPEHQATGAVPRPTDDTYYGSCCLAELRGKSRWQR